MDKITRKTSFEQWLSPISTVLFEEQVNAHRLDHYTKKLHMALFTKLLLYGQLHGTESLRAISDCVFSEELQEASKLESISFSQSKSSFMEASSYLDSKSPRKKHSLTARNRLW